MRKPKRSSDTDVPSKLQITSLGSAVWQDFVSASHAGTILLVESIIGRKCEYRHTTAGSYVVPVLDFEQFTKPHLVDDRVWHELNIEASQLQMDGKLPLPHPRCVFLFRRQETRFNPSALDLNFIHATKEGVLGVSVSRMISDSEQPPFNRWVLMPVQFALENGNNSITCMSNANLDESRAIP